MRAQGECSNLSLCLEHYGKSAAIRSKGLPAEATANLFVGLDVPLGRH
jgi:hypothetical protein